MPAPRPQDPRSRLSSRSRTRSYRSDVRATVAVARLSRSPASASLPPCCSFRSCSTWTRCPDLGDPLFSIWRFGWVFHKLGGDPRPLFSPNVFHPHPLTLTYSDSMLLPALTTAPFLAVGVHPVVAYNLVHDSELHRVGVGDVLLAERLTGLARGVVRRRAAVRVLSLPVRALQPFRAADDLLHAARAAGAASIPDRCAHERCRGVRRCWPPRSSTRSMYYAVFFTVYAAALVGVSLPAHTAAAATDARAGRHRRRPGDRCSRCRWRAPTARRASAIGTSRR